MLLSHYVFLVDFFTASQVAQIQFSTHQHSFSIGLIGLDQKLENRVGAGGVDVGARLSRDPASLTSLEQGETVSCVGHGVLTLALNEDALVLVLPDVERLLAVSVL